MPGREVHLKIGYDANRLRDAGIAGLLRDYQVLLEAIAANSGRNIAAVLQSCELPAEKTQGQLDLEYHLRLARPTAHLVDIEIDAAKVREPALDFVLPAWAPGRTAWRCSTR